MLNHSPQRLLGTTHTAFHPPQRRGVQPMRYCSTCRKGKEQVKPFNPPQRRGVQTTVPAMLNHSPQRLGTTHRLSPAAKARSTNNCSFDAEPLAAKARNNTHRLSPAAKARSTNNCSCDAEPLAAKARNKQLAPCHFRRRPRPSMRLWASAPESQTRSIRVGPPFTYYKCAAVDSSPLR